MTVPRLTQLTWECADPRALAAFWQQVLDLPAETGDDDSMTLVWEPVGRLTFHRVDGYEPASRASTSSPRGPRDRSGVELPTVWLL